VIGEALATRLAEPEGPEIVLVSTEHSPSYFDQMTMDRTRADLLRRLWAADLHGRFRAYFPRTSAGHTIIVHSKLAVIDETPGADRLSQSSTTVRPDSDTECDAAIEARTPAEQAAIARFRARLLGHFAHADPADVEMLAAERGLSGAVDVLARRSAGRLVRMEPLPMGPMASLVAAYHLCRSDGPSTDSWRPWRRRSRLEGRVPARSRLLSLLDPKIDDQRQVVRGGAEIRAVLGACTPVTVSERAHEDVVDPQHGKAGRETWAAGGDGRRPGRRAVWRRSGDRRRGRGRVEIAPAGWPDRCSPHAPSIGRRAAPPPAPSARAGPGPRWVLTTSSSESAEIDLTHSAPRGIQPAVRRANRAKGRP